MMDGQHGIDRTGLAAAATMLIPRENLFAEPGEVLPVGPLPVVAPLAQTPDIYRGRAAVTEKHPLPQTGTPSGPLPFPALARRLGRRRGCRSAPPRLLEAKTGHSRWGSREELPEQGQLPAKYSLF
jgi:hypothetical protein